MTADNDLPAASRDSTARRLLAEINADPELRRQVRQDLLGEEILNLPAQLAQLAAVVERLANAIEGLRYEFYEFRDATNTRLDNLETRVERLEGKFDRLDAKVDKGFARLDARMDTLDARIDALDAKVDSGFARLDARVNRLDGWVGERRGREYEQRCRETVSFALSRYLRRAKLVEPEKIADQLSDAFEYDIIDHSQYYDATMTDIIAQGYCRRLQSIVLVAAEVSIRLNRRDVDRARERADILAKATGQTFTAYCIGHRNWSDELENYAQEKAVTLVHYTWDVLTEAFPDEPDEGAAEG